LLYFIKVSPTTSVMAPSTVAIDTTPDFVMSSHSNPAPKASLDSQNRTLLLSPPSLSHNQSVLSALFTTYDRSTTDLQMLDRLSAGLATLPPSTYDSVLVLADADSTLSEASHLLNSSVLSRVAEALRPGGRVASQTGTPLDADARVARELVLAGLVKGEKGFEKPDYGEDAVPLRLLGRGKKKSDAGPAVANATVTVDGERTRVDLQPKAVPAGVGFVDLSDDLDLDGDAEDEELIDEDELLTTGDLAPPLEIR
jgi:hypothetical protein